MALWAAWNPYREAALFPVPGFPPQVGGYMLFRCVICHFEVQYDDVELQASRGANCICVRCYHREIGDEKALSKRKREDLARFVNGIEG